MELWIRSQDKESLLKVDRIYYDYSALSHRIMANKILVGTYKSKERALEILDEIQDLIKPKMVLTKVGEFLGETCDGTAYNTPDEYDIKEISTIVYEMPKE